MTTLDQKMSALEKGNRRRIERAKLRREIANLPIPESRALTRDVLSRPSEGVAGMTIYHLLISCRGLGPGRVTSILVRSGVHQHKRLNEMTERQRDRVLELLELTVSDPAHIRNGSC